MTKPSYGTSYTKDGVERRAFDPGFFCQPPLQVVLMEPEIPPNTGNVGRQCFSTGSALHLIEPLGFSIDERQVRRAGLDYWKDVDLHVHASFEDMLASKLIDPSRMFFFSTRSDKPYWDIPIQPGDALIFGKESLGLPQSLLDQYPEQIYHIPLLPGSVRSLNLSNAVAIALFDGYRRIAQR